jgi:hypothetical protein
MKNQRFVGNLFAKATMDRRVPKLSDRLRQEVAISVKRRMYSESFSLPTGTKRKVGSCLKFVRVALLTLRLPLRQAQGTLRANGVGFASAQILYMSRKVYAVVVASGWMVISAENRGKAERERLCRAGACGAARCYRLWSSGGDIIQKVPTSVANIPAAMARAIHSCRLMINPLANVLPTRESVDSVANS